MHALVIDDNQPAYDPLLPHLHHRGYATVGVKSIAEARRALEQQAFDLLLLERLLPDGDSSPLCNEVRERMGHKVVIIVISAHDTALCRAATLQLGADDFVSKPYDVEELVMRIQTLQRRQRMTTTSSPVTPDSVACNVRIDRA